MDFKGLKNKNITICEKSLKNDRWMNYYCDYDYDSWKPPKARVDWIRSQIEDNQNITILDIGCGAHPVSEWLSVKRKVGIDISLKAAERVSENFDQLYIADLNYLSKDDCPELLQQFDFVILAETLEHFENVSEIIQKVRWFLKPSGRLIITYPNHYSVSMYIDYFIHGKKYKRYDDFMEGHFTFYDLNQLKFIFHANGFTLRNFGYRACDIIPEIFPKESNLLWKKIANYNPYYLAHQFFFNLEMTNDLNIFPKRFGVVLEKGVRVIKEGADTNHTIVVG